jgi:hypothetical protein
MCTTPGAITSALIASPSAEICAFALGKSAVDMDWMKSLPPVLSRDHSPRMLTLTLAGMSTGTWITDCAAIILLA